MVSLVLRQYMRGENGTESLVGFFFSLAYSNRKTKCKNYRKTSAFGTCIQKYVVLERYVCLIGFMVIARTHPQEKLLFISYAYYVNIGPLSRYYVDMCPLCRYGVDIGLHSNYCADRFFWFLAVSWINTLTRMV